MDSPINQNSDRDIRDLVDVPNIRHIEDDIVFSSGMTLSEMRRRQSVSNLGKVISEETKKKLRESNAGSKNYAWKGKDVSYSGLHKWVNRWNGKANKLLCDCGVMAREWANISHRYKRELADYKAMCSRCHKTYDNIVTT